MDERQHHLAWAIRRVRGSPSIKLKLYMQVSSLCEDLVRQCEHELHTATGCRGSRALD